MANMSQDLDFDLFNWADAGAEEELETSDMAPSEELETSWVDEDLLSEVEWSADEWEVASSDDTSSTSEDDFEFTGTEDLNSIIDEILASNEEVDDKVEEIKDEAASSWNEDLLSLIDELQTMIAEKNLKIDELTKKNEVTSNKYMNSYWDAENYSFYKPTIEKLDNNPQLSMLVKNYDKEWANEKVVRILADMIEEKTGVNIDDAINASQKNSVGNALSTPSTSGMSAAPSFEEDEKDYNKQESLTNLF